MRIIRFLNVMLLLCMLTNTSNASLKNNHTICEDEFINLKSLSPGDICANLSITQIGGTAFEDWNFDGQINTDNFIGVKDITVTLTDITGAVQTTLTNTDGDYVFNGLDNVNTYRIEFFIPDSISQWASPSPIGNDNGGMVQFVKSGSCANLGLADDMTYCEDNSPIVTSCYAEGDQNGQSTDVMVSFRYGAVPFASENDDPNLIAHEALSNQIGSTFGLAYQKTSKTLFAAAYMKRFAGFKDSPATIYWLDNPADGNTSGSKFLDLEDLFGAGIAGIDPHDFSTTDIDPSPFITQNETLDAASFDAVGKLSFGDLEINETEDSLYVINLFDRSLYAMSIGSDPKNPVAPTNTNQVNVIPLASVANPLPGLNSNINNDEIRPFALKFYRGKLYIGFVGSGQSGGDLISFIYSYNPTDGSFSKVMETTLVYGRGCGFGVYSGGSICGGPADWNTWISSWPQNTTGPGSEADAAAVNIQFLGTGILGLEEGHPQPMFTDLEFDATGNIIIGLRDRIGDQGGTNAPYPGGEQVRLPNGNYVYRNNANPNAYLNDASSSTPNGYSRLYITNQDAFGDILYATKDGSGWSVDIADFTDNTVALQASQASFDNTSSAENFFSGDNYNDGLFMHEETHMGGLALYYESNVAIAPSMDPRVNAFSNGIDWFDMSNNAAKTKSITILTGANSPFGKAYGLGEMELICGQAPIEIGNYIWSDIDADGIQDPDEKGIANVNVALYSTTGILLATTITNGEGVYSFSHSKNTLQSWTNALDSVEAKTNYYIVVGNSQFSNDELSVDGSRYLLTIDSTDAGSNRYNLDNNGEIIATSPAAAFDNLPATLISTTNWGTADHSFDFGFKPCPKLSASGTNPSLCGLEDGAIILTLVNVPDGVYTINYEGANSNAETFTNIEVSNGNATINDLDNGVYNNISITNNDCSSGNIPAVNITLEDPPSPTLSATANDPTSCGGTDGKIDMTFTGIPDGSYNIDYLDGNNNQQTLENVMISTGTASFNNLGGGIYNDLTITLNTCTSTEDVDLVLIDPTPTLSAISTNPSLCGLSDGTIVFTFTNVVDGSYVIDYENENAIAETLNIIIANNIGTVNVGAGVFNNLSISFNGCSSIEDVDIQIADPAPPIVTLSNLINPSLCHFTDGNIELDFTSIPDGSYTINYFDENQMARSFENVDVINGNAIISNLGAGSYNSLTITLHDCISNILDLELTEICNYDFGDLPDLDANTGIGNYQTDTTNNGPGHLIIPGLYLGNNIDFETNGSPTVNANGDDDINTDDEDGLIFPTTMNLFPGALLKIPLIVTNTTVDTAFVKAWIDWNGDGDFEEVNELVVNINDGNNNNPFPSLLYVTIPAEVRIDQALGVRIRLSQERNMEPYGVIESGEVEDYLIQVRCKETCLKISSSSTSN